MVEDNPRRFLWQCGRISLVGYRKQMNQNILQKAITELKSDKPKIDYVLGMLETLAELTAEKGLQITSDLLQTQNSPRLGGALKPEGSKDEAAMLDAKARAAVDKIKSIGGVEIT